MFVDFCCICRTKMSSEDRGHCLPHSSLCTAAAAGNHPGRSSSLPHWTNHQIQFSLWSDGVITQSVLIWGMYKVCSREKNVNVWFMCRRDVGSGNYISAQRLWSTWLLPTCKRFPFIEQPLLVCWYVETFGHKFLHCGDLFIFSHLEDQQYDVYRLLYLYTIWSNYIDKDFPFLDKPRSMQNAEECNQSEMITLHQLYMKPTVKWEFTVTRDN